MGIVTTGSILSFVVFRLLPILAVITAVGIGWLASHELPLGLFFATVIPLLQGHVPATLIGHGHMAGSTPPVPDDFMPQPRPLHELFLTLPGTGDPMPQNGLGMCCRASAYDDELVYRTTLWYLLKGGRHIDTAHLYLNHAAIGRAIRTAIQRGIPRAEMFITTKIFPYHYGYNTTKATVPTYLTELGLDYIDLVLLHFPAPFPPYLVTNECTRRAISHAACREETWRALSELMTMSTSTSTSTTSTTTTSSIVIRNIGVSNFAVKHLQQLAGIGAPIANNQIQYSPFVPESVQETVHYCKDHGITITAYSPLGGMVDQDKAFAYSVLQSVSQTHHRPVSQIMLRWALQSGFAVIPGTGNPRHMDDNLDIYNFHLTEEDMTIINGLRRPEHAQKFFTMDVRDMD